MCRSSFTCGPEDGEEKCWCDALPHVPLAVGEDEGCLCPKCLREAISNLTAHEASSRSLAKIDETSQASLIEGVDYYCEGEILVFTDRYHLRRGYCCQSGCRHCPYQDRYEGTT
ncbi:MAG: DUF5522 domain-containing protein [Pyrinomonadaceae bacterium]